MSIATAITNAQNKVAAVYTACSNNGATLPVTQNLTNLPNCIASIPSKSHGKYKLLERIKDDSNNEIGTVTGYIKDTNNVEYAVVCLDAQYRLASGVYLSVNATITNMPTYGNSISGWWPDETNSATQNTQLILDYCTTNNYTSTACTHCRSKSFVIGGTTYYGQLPTMNEVFNLWCNRVAIENQDTSASSNPSLNLSSLRYVMASTQVNANFCWYLSYYSNIAYGNKTDGRFVAPVLELPNAL